ncbi:hypothetical protein M011DRAFT_401339 [Sporormia fimetaria CBS 119925]|uniref:VPS9 domain-containing protein n=1 Tax=Sporormia fimetaria CBS 119925 TaxID=1340428 RepID=A0A6A6VGD2_9PLEO|nr:hypothetical protein M011DRAFT_401339 [Sporormia fimetaria CBS 119925]
MPPILNPFLRAFFRSSLPSQCSPVQHHILLVPTTETLVSSRDRDANAPYAEACASEEFLASHILRIPGGVGPNNHVKDPASFRETRGKPKQYSTANGRTVIIRDAAVFGNKGFKTLNQAQLLNDIIFHPDTFDAQPWLVYFISRPLVGTHEATPILPATLPVQHKPHSLVHTSPTSVNGASSSMPKRKEVKSFGELLNHFPMIARQMQPGLERLFREFGKELEKPLPPTPPEDSEEASRSSRRRSSLSSSESVSLSLRSSLSHGHRSFISNLELDREEEMLRTSLETAVTAAIDLFQMVDKQQLSLLGATTDLTGPIVERMIERYITEQIHHTVLFPRLCVIRRPADTELESRIREMMDIDISQVGIDMIDGSKGKKKLAVRLSTAVDMFKRMGVAGSPQEMIEILVAVQKHITTSDASTVADKPGTEVITNGNSYSEKHNQFLTVNADTLVSLLLIVVIRSSVRHLQARLSYMRHFVFIDDVESGEMGYALSTFEAVLSYLSRDSGGLRRCSQRNRRLWRAARTGDVDSLRKILEPESSTEDADTDTEPPDEQASKPSVPHTPRCVGHVASNPFNHAATNGDLTAPAQDSGAQRSEDSPLAHVFPFQRALTPAILEPSKTKKRVSLNLRSLSVSSVASFKSRTTVDSRASGFEGDTSIETLSKTHGLRGESVLMFAVENGQHEALRYLISLHDYYPLDFVLDDCTNDGTTLLSATIQHGHSTTTDVLLAYILETCPKEQVVKAYIAKQDDQGRCVAHYLFNQPSLIENIGHLIPWRLKDKNGQTPVFALCRSYDHDEYRHMVDQALAAATQAQGDGLPLHLDEHIDHKGNSLLHIINDPFIAMKLLYRCDSDVNATNERHFTPLMVASKYGRTELVRVFFQDARVDVSARDMRGLTAVELAKDDEVRNRIDDLVLLTHEPRSDGRITAVVRSFFVEDGSVKLVVKSGAPNDNSSITITTSRRSVQDFESLARWLAQENPASWLPSLDNLASPFLIPSRPSRSILRDTQARLDAFLQTLLSHPTFSTHELVWEFFLVPDINLDMLAERSARKVESRKERIRDEYLPLYDVREVEIFVQHARESVRSVHHASRSVLRRTNKMRNAASDFVDAANLGDAAIKLLTFLPPSHTRAIMRFTKTLGQSEASPLSVFHNNFRAISDCTSAILTALNRPSLLITSMSAAQRDVDRHQLSIRRSDRWPLGLLDDARIRMQKEAQEKMDVAADEVADLGRELRHTQQVVASELASWQEGRVQMGRKTIKEFARKTLVTERARLESMKRAIRELGIGLPKTAAKSDDTSRPPTTEGRDMSGAPGPEQGQLGVDNSDDATTRKVDTVAIPGPEDEALLA